MHSGEAVMPVAKLGFLVALWALLCTSSAALGQAQMPYYDVDTYCASESGGASMGLSFCIDREQHDYNNLQDKWARVEPDIQVTCVQQNPIPSYSRLGACVLNIESDRMLLGRRPPPGFQH
jgi:hypothetical protein